MTRPVRGEDLEEAVGRFFAADLAARAGEQRIAKAADAVEAVYDPVRAADRGAVEAVGRLRQLDAAQAAADRWSEALAAQRDTVMAAARARQSVSARGAAGRQAREQVAALTLEGIRHREVAVEWQGKTQELAEELGTMDPARWAKLREESTVTVEAYAGRRAAALAEAAAAFPEARAALQEARVETVAAVAAREEVAAELAGRGVDVDRLREAAARSRGPSSFPEQPGDPATEAAISGWRERQAEPER